MQQTVHRCVCEQVEPGQQGLCQGFNVAQCIDCHTQSVDCHVAKQDRSLTAILDAKSRHWTVIQQPFPLHRCWCYCQYRWCSTSQ